MNVSQPFHSSHNIGGVECNFPSKEELMECLAGHRAGLTHIVTLNAEMVVEAQRNEHFKNIINNAEIVIPDGSSILWAREYLRNRHPGPRAGIQARGFLRQPGMTMLSSLVQFFFSKHQPLPGIDLIFDICEIMQKKKGTVYLLGGKQYEAQKTAEILRKKYPGITAVCLPPQRLVFSPLTPSVFPAVILVALGSPKQSLWIEEYRTTLEDAGITIAMGVGGAFAMIAGTLPRAPKWMRTHHMEWLWRLILEPMRIKRIWNAVVVFPLLIDK